ncbi:MAG: patatin-like phospholipase family protein [Minisyncoccales bacterium]
MVKRKKVGVALSGGGSKGIAHIGVLKILEEYNVPIDFISGTSMGSVIGALYCSGYSLKKIEYLFTEEEKGWKKLLDYTFPKHGLIKGKKIENFIEDELKNIKFKDLEIPLYVTSFDIDDRREIVFNRGSVSKAVRASISIPGMIVPVENKNRILVDGGIVDPIPTEVLKKKGAEIIIAVNVDEKKKKSIKFEKAVEKKGKKKIPGIWDIASKSFKAMSHEIYMYDLTKKGIDFIIHVPTRNKEILSFSKKANKQTIKDGEKAAEKSLEKIQKATKPHPFKDFLESLTMVDEKIKKETSKTLPLGKTLVKDKKKKSGKK